MKLSWPVLVSTKRARVVLGACVALFLVPAVAYAVFAPNWYESTTLLMPAQRKSPNLGSLLGASGGIAADVGSALSGGGAGAERVASVLESALVSDGVIQKFGLQERYGERHMENARRALWEHCVARVLPKSGLVSVTCEDRDPKTAQAMLQTMADLGNDSFRRVGAGSSTEEVRFLEKRVQELRDQADAVAQRMLDFEQKYQIVDLETQTKAVVSSLAALRNQQISKELELEYARTFSSSDEATARQLRSQLSIVDEKLRDLEAPDDQPSNVEVEPGPARGASRKSAGKLFPSALAVPKLRSEFEKLIRDRKAVEASLFMQTQKLEAAKADEAREASTFMVVDPATLPSLRSRPKRGRLLAGSLFAGLFFGLAFLWLERSSFSFRRTP